MSIESAVKARLDGFAGLRSYVGNRNFAIQYPQGTTLPATTLEIINERPVHAMGSDASVKEARMRVNTWATDFSTCRETDEQVRQALSRYRGTSGGTVVQDILEETVNDIFHPEVGEGVYQRARDFRAFYEVS